VNRHKKQNPLLAQRALWLLQAVLLSAARTALIAAGSAWFATVRLLIDAAIGKHHSTCQQKRCYGT